MIAGSSDAKAGRFFGLRPAHVAIVTSACLIAGAWTLAPGILMHGADHAVGAASGAGSPRSSGFAEVVEAVKPAVFAVHIKVVPSKQPTNLPGVSNQPFRDIENAPDPRTSRTAVAHGSGFFISP